MNGSPLEAARQISRIFGALSIRHAIVGSVASSLRGVPRATVDVDFVVDLQQAHVIPLMNALNTQYYMSEEAAVEAIRRTGMFNLIHTLTGYKIDVHLVGEDPYEQTKLARAISMKVIEGDELKVATAEDLILSKLRWYRLGGETSERQWKDVLGIFLFQPKLDLDYLTRWAENLRISDLLERAIQESKP